ncbi:MAG TPA: hypothetical protein VGI86_15430 [Acidimicrobiia bacterium]
MRHRAKSAVYFDSNGVLTERRWLGGQEVIVHYDDIPASDMTVVDGIRCTTALRTVIDLAPDLSHKELRRMVDDCLVRQLFTADEAIARASQPDIAHRPGARLLLELLTG